ncbi:hypothetical protein WKI71_15995 [Streptomyces sp. MS1.AVA.1]|uniref:Uncharacterized protein n=1 Tax=Streptomyces machairae TaxID=3134109 RepID=A0ABU8UKF2_9ACTN
MSPTKVTPAVVPAADTVARLASDGGIAKGSAFDKKNSGGMSGVYLDGMDPDAAKRPTIPVKNPAGSGTVQVRPLQAPTASGLGTLLPKSDDPATVRVGRTGESRPRISETLIRFSTAGGLR